jgi:hypothetical protein
MAFEVLVSGESTLADDTLEWLIGHTSARVRNRHSGGKTPKSELVRRERKPERIRGALAPARQSVILAAFVLCTLHVARCCVLKGIRRQAGQ